MSILALPWKQRVNLRNAEQRKKIDAQKKIADKISQESRVVTERIAHFSQENHFSEKLERALLRGNS